MNDSAGLRVPLTLTH